MRKAPGQCFRTIHDIDAGLEEKLEHAKRTHHLVTMMILSQWDGSEDSQRSSQSSRSEPRWFSDQYGIEVQVKYMLNNGSLSRIVISRGPNRYVDEVYEEKEEPSHDEEMASGASIEKSIATKKQEQSSPPVNPPSKTSIPIDQRKWNDIPVVGCVRRVPSLKSLEGDKSVSTYRSSSRI